MSGIANKRPFIKKTVGNQYVNFNKPSPGVDYDVDSWEDETIKHETIKNIGVTENEESTAVRGSGKVYTTVTQRASTQIAMDVLAFDKETISKMRAETNDGGLRKSGAPATRPYFGYGYVEEYDGDNFRYVWYPKCQLASNTKDIATQEESFSEQNDTLTISAYAFDGKNDHVYIDSEMSDFPEGVTEDVFFKKPIYSLDALDNEGA